MNFTFTQVDPSKKPEPQLKWTKELPKDQQKQFKQFDMEKSNVSKQTNNSKCPVKKISTRELIINEMNKKLKDTIWTYQLLEEKYGEEPICVGLSDLNGNSIWFNKTYMAVMNRSEKEYFCVNYLDTLKCLNEQHPLTEIMEENYKYKPKEFRLEASLFTTYKHVHVGFEVAVFVRIDTVQGEPFGYLARFIPKYD
eukprot:gene8052-12514_t